MIVDRHESPANLQHGRRLPPLSAPVDSCQYEGRNLKLADLGNCSGLRAQQAAVVRAPQLQQRPWFEREMPQPIEDIASELLPDPVLTTRLQDPVDGLALYQRELQHREAMEKANEEYRFAPLRVTLQNMKKLTEHMLNGKQFSQPLVSDESRVLARFQGHIEELIALGAPYKRTVKLALLMCILLEIMTTRRVIEPLRETKPELFSRKRMMTARFLHVSQGQSRELKTASIPLDKALTCRWGGLNVPEQQGEPEELISDFIQANALMKLLENGQVFLYPSFKSLDLGDFCGFGHLPVYPLGMMSGYALNADGKMRTPLAFLIHDAAHTSSNQTWLHLDGTAPLESLANRLRFQRWARAGLPAVVQEEHKLERAVELVLFQLLHEMTVDGALDTMDADSFLPLFQSLCNTRRRLHMEYSQAYRTVTDRQALLACFWVYQVYRAFRTGTACRGAVPDKLVSRFVEQDLPALLEHQSVIDEHREALHQHFLSRARVFPQDDGSSRFYYKKFYCEGISKSAWLSEDLIMLEATDDPEAEARVRHTDLCYFNALLVDEECASMQQKLGVKLPSSRPHQPSSRASD